MQRLVSDVLEFERSAADLFEAGNHLKRAQCLGTANFDSPAFCRRVPPGLNRISATSWKETQLTGLVPNP